MGNIFENAYFGKVYKTRDGHKAIYLFSYDCIIKTTHNLVVNVHHDDTHLCEIVTGDDGRVGSIESPFDIVSEWETSFDEDKMNSILDEGYKMRETAEGRKKTGGWYWRKWAEWGYRKAMEK